MERKRLVVIGNGMAGARLVDDVLARDGRDQFDIAMFGDEPHGNYNRILLSSVLSGTHDPGDIFINPLSWYGENNIRFTAGVRAVRIDREAKVVLGEDDSAEEYDKLVIATGSSPFVPPIEGVTRTSRDADRGIFLFRTLDDCRAITERAAGSKRAAVIGGGLLGLEAARGLLNLGLETHIVHLMPHLMETQLDSAAGSVLKSVLERMGLTVHLRKTTTAVTGNGRVDGLIFEDGSRLGCDLVVISAGIRPNTELAREAGLEVRRGIVVGDDLSSVSDPDVYAVGECAEHRGVVYGLVAPLWEQTRVLADRLTNKNAVAVYLGSKLSTRLKVMGVDLTVMGEKEAQLDDEEVTYAEPARGIYKKLIVRSGRLAGAILLGDSSPAASLLQSFDRETELPESKAEILFPGDVSYKRGAVKELSDAALVCNCNGVSRGEVLDAIKAGHCSIAAVASKTRATTGCGTCAGEVQTIIDSIDVPSSGPRPGDQPWPGLFSNAKSRPAGIDTVVETSRPPNKIEQLKAEKDGLEILGDIPRLARDGWEAISEGDRERLKWAGVFFRKQTPGFFMMRLRMPGGQTNAEQLRLIADISDDCGKGFVDITTRQQIQLRWFQIGKVPDLFKDLESVGLTSLQTGMDNIRNVVGCAAAGLTANELFDASQVVREYTSMFVGDRKYTNLPRKFNVAITGCRENCTHAESQDVAMTPAVKVVDGDEMKGFNVAVGGKMGSGGYRPASPLDLFVRPDEAAEICKLITLIFRDHGFRTSRARARLAFLIDEWGISRFRRELEARADFPLLLAGKDVRTEVHADHIGIFRQRQPGLNYVGFVVPVGRITSGQLREVARLAKHYGNSEVRITTAQNLIIPNVPDSRIVALSEESLFKDLRYDPSEVMRGTVSCTGIDYCSLALIETKELAMKTARDLESRIGRTKPITIHWSGCPAGCGNHAAADIGVLGKNIRVGHEVVEVADVFVGGKAGPNPRPPIRLLENVPCRDLPRVLEQLVPNLSGSVAASRAVRAVISGHQASPREAAGLTQSFIDASSASGVLED